MLKLNQKRKLRMTAQGQPNVVPIDYAAMRKQAKLTRSVILQAKTELDKLIAMIP